MTNAKIIINWCPHQRQPWTSGASVPGGCSPRSHKYHYSLSKKTPAGIAKRTEKKHLKSVDALPHAGAIKNMMSISKLRSGIGSRTLGGLHRTVQTPCIGRCIPPACIGADPLHAPIQTLCSTVPSAPYPIMRYAVL